MKKSASKKKKCILVYGIQPVMWGPNKEEFPDVKSAKKWLVEEAFPNDFASGGHVEDMNGKRIAGPWYRKDFGKTGK